MIKHFCDRCEKEVDAMNASMYIGMYFSDSKKNTEYHFCEECAEIVKKAINAAIEEGKENA